MRSRLLQKRAYGYDQTGEVLDHQQENVRDNAEPERQHQTPTNPVNAITDVDAEMQFPELRRKPNILPSRSRE